MKWRGRLVLVFVVLSYLAIGAAIFSVLERSKETENKAETIDLKQLFLENHTCVTEDDLENLIRRILVLHKTGIHVLNNSSSRSNWDYFNSVFFCLTVITTVGYGNLSPTTSAGKATLVFYAIFGIALFLVLLCDLGTVIGATTEKLLSRFASCRRRMRKGQVVMKVTLLLGSGMIPFIFLPALLFSMMESWDYGTSLYYVVVSLSTVGFGDYVAGQGLVGPGQVIYRIFICVWLVLGLAWFSGLMSIMQDQLDVLNAARTESSPQRHKENGQTKNGADPISISVMQIRPELTENSPGLRTDTEEGQDPPNKDQHKEGCYIRACIPSDHEAARVNAIYL